MPTPYPLSWKALCCDLGHLDPKDAARLWRHLSQTPDPQCTTLVYLLWQLDATPPADRMFALAVGHVSAHKVMAALEAVAGVWPKDRGLLSRLEDALLDFVGQRGQWT